MVRRAGGRAHEGLVLGLASHAVHRRLRLDRVHGIGQLLRGNAAGDVRAHRQAHGMQRRLAGRLVQRQQQARSRLFQHAIQLQRLDHAFTLQKQFIADAAHELRTPIMGLGLQAELLPQAANDRERDELVQSIRTGTVQLTHLAGQLLTLARLDPDAGQANRRRVDLTRLARSVVADRERLAEANQIDLGVVGAQSAVVQGSDDNLRVLLNNLVDNAIRYAGAHARVDVTVRRDTHHVVLEVSDNGPGIPEPDRARAWERFYRGGGHAGTGSGLGLSIVRRVAEQHHASVALETGPEGRGLTVRVRFPA